LLLFGNFEKKFLREKQKKKKKKKDGDQKKKKADNERLLGL